MKSKKIQLCPVLIRHHVTDYKGIHAFDKSSNLFYNFQDA